MGGWCRRVGVWRRLAGGREHWPGTTSIANGDKQTTTCAKCENCRLQDRIVWLDDNLPMPSCTNVRGSPSRLAARTHQSKSGPTAHPGPTFLILLKSAPARRTSEEALHYGVTAAATGITEGAHESRPPRSSWPQGPAVTPAACTRCYIAQRRTTRPSGCPPRQAAAHSPARTCPGSRCGGCSRSRCAGLRHG